jgi:subtilisin family serine protease
VTTVAASLMASNAPVPSDLAYEASYRPSLGARVDPSYDAQVGRQRFERKPRTSASSGYIELFSDQPGSAYKQLKILIAVLYGRATLTVVPHVWTQIQRLRYLTTHDDVGIALPLHSFNPSSERRGDDDLNNALLRLDDASSGRLAVADFIGLTVDFNFVVDTATPLQSIFSGFPGKPGEGLVPPQHRGKLDGALFGFVEGGPSSGLERIDMRDVAVGGSISPQLKNAIRELRDGGDGPAFAAINPQLAEGTPDLNGEGVIVGVVDFGCDFAHPSFCSQERTESRILALWDQNATTKQTLEPIVAPEKPVVRINGQECEFGFGRVFTREAINSVLKEWRTSHSENRLWPYQALGYDPHDNHYLSTRPVTAHGTCVLDIAAGGERPWATSGDNNPVVKGMAPGSHIVFVQIRTHLQEDGRRTLDSNDVVDGVAYIFHLAEQMQKSCVVNLSLNTMSGPHDGDGHFERRLSNLLRSGAAGKDIVGRAVVVAAGNLPDKMDEWRKWQHIAANVTNTQPFEFCWNLFYAGEDKTRNSLEIWYEARNAWLQIKLTHKHKGTVALVNPGHAAEILCNGKVVGSIIGSKARPAIIDNASVKRGSAPNLPASDQTLDRNVIYLSIDPHAGGDVYWTVSLALVDSANQPLGSRESTVPFDVWLERDDEGQTGIARREGRPPSIEGSDRKTSIGTLSCGKEPIVVASYDASRSSISLCPSSASGPTRGGKAKKPDISAPGVDLRLVLSKSDRGRVLQSGTSLAAPFVTGTIACLYQLQPKAKLEKIKEALFRSARHTDEPGELVWSERLGWGRLSPRGALDWLREHPED